MKSIPCFSANKYLGQLGKSAITKPPAYFLGPGHNSLSFFRWERNQLRRRRRHDTADKGENEADGSLGRGRVGQTDRVGENVLRVRQPTTSYSYALR